MFDPLSTLTASGVEAAAIRFNRGRGRLHMLSLLLLGSLQGASGDVDAASLKLVQCYFAVVRSSEQNETAANLDRSMSQTCSNEEAALRAAGRPRLDAMGKSAQLAADEVDELIRSVRGGLAEDAARWRGQSIR